jgi:hypothetical protein
MSKSAQEPDNPGPGMMIKLSEFQARARAAANAKAREPLDRMQPLHVEMRGQDILITMPGTGFRVVYLKPDGGQLAAMVDYSQNQRNALFTRLQFLTRARKLANEKARELGWIV